MFTGRSYAVFTQKMLNGAIDSLVQKVQSGVVISFEKMGPDPPPIVINEVNKGLLSTVHWLQSGVVISFEKMGPDPPPMVNNEANKGLLSTTHTVYHPPPQRVQSGVVRWARSTTMVNNEVNKLRFVIHSPHRVWHPHLRGYRVGRW